MILAINIHRLTVSQWVMVLYLEQKLLSNEEHLLVWSKIDSKGMRFVLVRYLERYHIWDKAESEWLRLFCIVKRKVKITNILPTNVCWVWFVANLWLDSVWLKFRFCSVIYWFGAKGWEIGNGNMGLHSFFSHDRLIRKWTCDWVRVWNWFALGEILGVQNSGLGMKACAQNERGTNLGSFGSSWNERAWSECRVEQ